LPPENKTASATSVAKTAYSSGAHEVDIGFSVHYIQIHVLKLLVPCYDVRVHQ